MRRLMLFLNCNHEMNARECHEPVALASNIKKWIFLTHGNKMLGKHLPYPIVEIRCLGLK